MDAAIDGKARLCWLHLPRDYLCHKGSIITLAILSLVSQTIQCKLIEQRQIPPHNYTHREIPIQTYTTYIYTLYIQILQ